MVVHFLFFRFRQFHMDQMSCWVFHLQPVQYDREYIKSLPLGKTAGHCLLSAIDLVTSASLGLSPIAILIDFFKQNFHTLWAANGAF